MKKNLMKNIKKKVKQFEFGYNHITLKMLGA